MLFTLLVAFVLGQGSNGEPTVLPLTDANRADFLEWLNAVRANVTSSNMEALTEWSPALEEEAVKLGSQCSSSPTHEVYGVGIVQGETTPSDVYTALVTIGKDFTLSTLSCGAGVSSSACESYKQFVWYKGGLVGCAIVHCTDGESGVSTTCVFEHKKKSQELYISGDACLFCGSGKCDGSLCVPVTSTAAIGACGSKPSELVPLYRWVHKSRYDTVLSTEKSMGASLAVAYEDKGIFGYISPTANSGCKYLAPLLKMSATNKVDFVYVVGAEYLTLYNQKYYSFVSSLGYVVTDPGLCGANVTAHQFLRSSTWNYYTSDDEEASEIMLRAGTYAAFYYVEKPFALWGSA